MFGGRHSGPWQITAARRSRCLALTWDSCTMRLPSSFRSFHFPAWCRGGSCKHGLLLWAGDGFWLLLQRMRRNYQCLFGMGESRSDSALLPQVCMICGSLSCQFCKLLRVNDKALLVAVCCSSMCRDDQRCTWGPYGPMGFYFFERGHTSREDR